MSEVAQDAGPSKQTAPTGLNATPRSDRSHGGTLAQTTLRGEIASEMVNEILECPVAAFLDHYAPFDPSADFVTTAYNDLKSQSLLEEEVENGGKIVLADFTSFEETESIIFKRLGKIMRALEKVEDGTRRERSFSYKDCPSSNMASEIDGTNFKVDACITSEPLATTVILSDVAAIAEFKKAGDPKDIEDNRLKLISAATQIMNDDPTRMWVYGITIERTQMAVWYFCRSHSVKSKSFDFTTDVNTFIRVFLSLLYATRPEIGFDPTVTRVKHQGKICYVYEVGTDMKPRYYRTTELIFAARVLCITGRKTRIWKAVEVAGPKPGQFGKRKPGTAMHVVLKDGWLDENSPSEKKIQTRIFEQLGKVGPSDYGWAEGFLRQRLSEAFMSEKYKEYFMGILDSRLLRKTKPRHDLAMPSPDILAFAEPKPIDPLHKLGGTTQSGNRSGKAANTPSRTSGKKDNFHPREYKTKQQHRLIYDHVGCDLNHAKDLSASFLAIHDIFIALVLLYLAGWTHRDISPGNIIIVKKGGRFRGKLSDLEYAKAFTDTTFSADPKTGTAYFMPLEIHMARSLYTPKVDLPSKDEVDIFDPSDSEDSEDVEREADEETRPMKFRFSHDIESLWWVVVWILLFRVGGKEALDLAGRLFTSTDTPSNPRYIFFTNNKDGLKSYIHEELLHLTPRVFDIRDILYSSYKSKEKTDDLMNPIQYQEIYTDVWKPLTRLIRKAVKVKGIDFQNPNHSDEKAKKRPRSESEPGDDDEYMPHLPRRQRKHILT